MKKEEPKAQFRRLFMNGQGEFTPAFIASSRAKWLWRGARSIRSIVWGRDVHFRGIVEFSNHCRQNCLYCGLRRDNADLVRYRLDNEAVFTCAAQIKGLGFGTVVLQSGEDAGLDAEALARLIRRIKSELGLAVTLSVGEREEGEYQLWREAGADRYLLKMETLNEALYASLRPGRRLEQRLETFRFLQDLGYEAGTGLIAGLPGESDDYMEHAAKRLAEFKPDMFSISPFTPHPATPLAGHSAYSPRKTLLRMAAARIWMPEAHIPVTSALSLHGDAFRLAGLEVGDVIMPSLTPEPVREAYAIYAGKNIQNQSPLERAEALRDTVIAAGFCIAAGPGGRHNRSPAKTGAI